MKKTIYSKTREQAASMSTPRLKRWKRALHRRIGQTAHDEYEQAIYQQELNAVEKELKEREEREQHL